MSSAIGICLNGQAQICLSSGSWICVSFFFFFKAEGAFEASLSVPPPGMFVQ